MTSSNQPRLARQVHLDVKDHVTTDLLIERWDNIVVVELERQHVRFGEPVLRMALLIPDFSSRTNASARFDQGL